MSRKFERGTDLIKKSAKGTGGKRMFTPNIYWGAGEVRTIAFLTEANDVPKVRMHKLVNIPDDTRPKGIRYETFLCKKDSSMVDDYNGQCELCDEVGHEATVVFVALAVELDVVREGKKVISVDVKVDDVVNKEGVTNSYTRWGLVMQASKNFFAYFAAYDEATGPITEVAWEIHREGGGTDTKYHPFVVMTGTSAAALPDLTGVVDSIPTLDELLEEMGTDEKYAEVANLQPGSQPTFGGKKTQTDTGTMPTGDRSSEFSKIKDDVNAARERDKVVASY